MKKIKKQCLYCKQEFKADIREHNRGNARYCSISCSTTHSNTKRSYKEYECVCCNKRFKSNGSVVKYCSKNCRVKHYRQQSTRNKSYGTKTLQNKLKDFSCMRCNWQEGPRDVHHIIPITQGGQNDKNNLIVLCPNCHRLAHRNLLSKEELLKLLEKWTISSSVLDVGRSSV